MKAQGRQLCQEKPLPASLLPLLLLLKASLPGASLPPCPHLPQESVGVDAGLTPSNLRMAHCTASWSSESGGDPAHEPHPLLPAWSSHRGPRGQEATGIGSSIEDVDSRQVQWVTGCHRNSAWGLGPRSAQSPLQEAAYPRVSEAVWGGGGACLSPWQARPGLQQRPLPHTLP